MGSSRYLNIEHKLIKDLNLLFDLNLLALSADDNWDGTNTTVLIYSGRSRSKTIILTEDELRDRGGNMDELISQKACRRWKILPQSRRFGGYGRVIWVKLQQLFQAYAHS